MPIIDGYANVRVVPVPLDSDKPRPCDIEVSSDGGKTWATMLTTNIVWDGDTISVSFPVKLAAGN
jgi:hypothetical protein